MSSQPPHLITLEAIQQMIINAFSALEISGNHQTASTAWYFDSGASNHMTSSPAHLSNVQKYTGDLQIHIADGENLPLLQLVMFPIPCL